MADSWDEARLDMILVPAGLILLLAYHAHLVYRVCRFPTTTVIGVNQITRQAWVHTLMKDGLKNGVLGVQTLRNNIMAATLLATAAITISSVIAVLVSGTNGVKAETRLVFGDKGALTSSTKLLCVLVCFLISFLCNVQSVRYYSHVGFLISIPLAGDGACGLTLEYIYHTLIRGSQFWSIGLRSFYFSFPMFLWLFGPLPMFICCLVTTTLLHFLDTAKDFKHTFQITPEIDSIDLKVVD